MDFYVRQLGATHEHDQFYVNHTIIDAFKNYVTQVVSRYVDSPAVFAWEIANDARCSSSLKATPQCTTNTVTNWHSIIAKHIRSLDPNHLVSSGHQGFFCADCPKLFPRVTAPPPQTSSTPGRRRRSAEPMTRVRLLKERKALWKKKREEQKRAGQLEGGVRVRGRWTASPTKRQQDIGPGTGFDGSQGVDGEDIINIPEISFGTFQLFPDQNTYGPVDDSLLAFNQTVQTGLDWIRRQGETGRLFNKPISMIAFGLVTQDNAPFFVPVNSTQVAAPASTVPQSTSAVVRRAPFGVTDGQRDDAYSQWIQEAIQQGLKGAVQYQWGQTGLTAQLGTTVSPVQDQTGTTPNQNSTGVSPNDGYSINGQGSPAAQNVLEQGAAQISARDLAT
jgi:mannan endo-1,4-beta-mannosidase